MSVTFTVSDPNGTVSYVILGIVALGNFLFFCGICCTLRQEIKSTLAGRMSSLLNATIKLFKLITCQKKTVNVSSSGQRRRNHV